MTNNDFNVYTVSVPTPLELRTYNFYIVQMGERVLLIDAGIDTEACWQTFLKTLHQHQLAIQQVSAIVITHSHLDHTGLVARILQENPNVILYAHENAAPRLKRDMDFLEKRIRFFESLYKEMGCGERGKSQINVLKAKVTENVSYAITASFIPLKDGDVLHDLKVLFTPGHWPDHIALFHENSGTLFAGDLLVEHISTNALIEPDTDGNRLYTLLQHEQSQQQMLKYPIQRIYTGHGNPILNAEELITKRLSGIERKGTRVLHVVQALEKSHAAHIAQQMYPHKYESEFQLVMSEIIGHLDRLEALGKVMKVKKQDIWMYSVPFRNIKQG